MKLKLNNIFFLMVLLILIAPSASAQEEDELLEYLLFSEVPVVSSSKRVQTRSTAASNVTVITAEDIKMSGAVLLTDVLRQMVGVQVQELERSAPDVGIRGISDNRHALVTLDGNNLFIYHANVIFWESIPISLEEIDRIEITKGPGGIFQGGHAFTGSINIITKSPEETRGTTIHSKLGEDESYFYSLVHSASLGSLDYTIDVGHREYQNWFDNGSEVTSDFINFKGVYNLEDEKKITLMVRDIDSDEIPMNLGTVRNIFFPANRYIGVNYESPTLTARAFYNHHVKPGVFVNPTELNHTVFPVNQTRWEDDNYEFEVIKRFDIGDSHLLSIGGYARKTYLTVSTTNSPDGDADTEQFALNIEDEIRLSETFSLYIGGRFENHSVLDNLGMGRVSGVWQKSENTTWRLTAATAYFVPSLHEQILDGFVAIGGASSILPLAGNQEIDEEKVDSIELSYLGKISDHIQLELAVFYNEFNDLITFLTATNSQGVATSENKYNMDLLGAELEVRYLINEYLSGFVNYAYLDIDRDDNAQRPVPENKINYGLKAYLSSRLSFSLVGHWVDDYIISEAVGTPVSTPIDSYHTVDAKISYRPNEVVELGISATNVFEDEHVEEHLGALIGRRAYISLDIHI